MIFDKHFNETSTSLLLDVKEGQVPGATPLHIHTLMSMDDTHTHPAFFTQSELSSADKSKTHPI